MGEIYKFGEYEFELKSSHADTLTSLQPLPKNISLRTRDGPLFRNGDTFFITCMDKIIQFCIDDRPVYKLYKCVSYEVVEVPTLLN